MRVSRREFLKAGGVLVVGAGLVDLASSSAGAQTLPNADRFLGKPLAADQVDSFLAIHADGSLTVFSGKVDMGTGGRIAMRQIVAEELDVQPDRIAMIEGDTALTPDQGSTAGSYGIARGGMQLRQAAATARRALLALAAPRLGRGLDDLEVADGVVRTKDGRASVSYAELIGDRALGVAVDPKAPVKDPQRFRFIGKSLARPDVPAKVTGRHKYLHDLTLPGMLHARVLRPPALGATLRSVDESSIKTISGARVVRVESFVGVVAEREWDAVRAAGLLRAEWTGGTALADHATLFDAMRASPVVREQEVARRGGRRGATLEGGRPPGPRPVESSGRARLGSEGTAAAPPAPRRGRRARRGRGLGDARVAAGLDRQSPEPPVPRGRRGAHRAAAGPGDRPDLPEHPPALSVSERRRGRALDSRRAASHVTHSRAGEDREQLRGRVVRGRDRRARRYRSGGVPAAASRESARRRGAPARGRAPRGSPGRLIRS